MTDTPVGWCLRVMVLWALLASVGGGARAADAPVLDGVLPNAAAPEVASPPPALDAAPTAPVPPPAAEPRVPAVEPGVEPEPAVARVPVAPVTDCDRLAQPLRRVMNPGSVFTEGVDYAELRWPAARAVCLRAIADYPEEARFVAYLGRAADKGGDAVEAARLYRAAADAGNAMAQNNLAAMFETGDGKQVRSNREAVRLYRLAAAQGFPDAQTSMAGYYATGSGGVLRDDREAVRLWQVTASLDDAVAQYGLGRMYAEARGGLARDMTEAVRLWRLAAAGGSAEAQWRLRRSGRQ